MPGFRLSNCAKHSRLGTRAMGKQVRIKQPKLSPFVELEKALHDQWPGRAAEPGLAGPVVSNTGEQAEPASNPETE